MSSTVSVETIRSKILDLILKYETHDNCKEKSIVNLYLNQMTKQFITQTIFPQRIIELIVIYYDVEGFKVITKKTDDLMNKWRGKHVELLMFLYKKYGIHSDIKLKPTSITSFKISYSTGKLLYNATNYTIRECKDKVNKKRYAVKIIHTTHMNSKELNQLQQTINIWREISNPSHPNIVSMQNVFSSDTKTFVIIDLCHHKSLNDVYHKTQSMDENKIKTWLKDIICGIQHLHQQHIIHRNISLKSVLFEDNTDDSKLKLTSFEKAIHVEDLKQQSNTTMDMSSVGKLLSQMLATNSICDTNKGIYLVLFTLINICSTMLVINCLYSYVDLTANDLVQRLLEKDSTKCLTATEALQHEWFKDSKDMKHNIVSLDYVQLEFKVNIGHKPHTKSQLLQFCKYNKFPFKFKEINQWWPTRPDPEGKPQQEPINADEIKLLQYRTEQKQAEPFIMESDLKIEKSNIQEMNQGSDDEEPEDDDINESEEMNVSEDNNDDVEQLPEQQKHNGNESEHSIDINTTNEIILIMEHSASNKIDIYQKQEIERKKENNSNCCRYILCCCKSPSDTDYKALEHSQDLRNATNLIVGSKKRNEELPLMSASQSSVNYTNGNY